MSFDQTANASPGAPSADSVADKNLEAQLRGMLLSNSQMEAPNELASQQRQTAPFFGMPEDMGGPVTGFNQLPHPTTQTPGLPPTFSVNSDFLPIAQGLPPSGSPFPGREFANVPAPQVPYQTYPGSSPGLQSTGLPPQNDLQYLSSQRAVAQYQSSNMSPNTPPRQDYIPPHMRHIYKQQSTPLQYDSPPRQHQQLPQVMPVQTRQHQTPPRHGHSFNNPQNISRVPPPTALDHFPPLGTQPAKTKPSPPAFYEQQSTAQNSQQRIQYQPLPANTRKFNPPVRGGGPVRGNFRTPNYTGRPTHQYIEQISIEQSHYLNEFAKRIIAEAAPPESETSVKHALLKRLEAICKEVSPDAKLIPFGSLVSKSPYFSLNTHLLLIFSKNVFHRLGYNKYGK